MRKVLLIVLIPLAMAGCDDEDYSQEYANFYLIRGYQEQQRLQENAERKKGSFTDRFQMLKGQLDVSIGELGEKVTKLGAVVTAVSESVSAGFTELRGRFDSLEARVEKLEQLENNKPTHDDFVWPENFDPNQ